MRPLIILAVALLSAAQAFNLAGLFSKGVGLNHGLGTFPYGAKQGAVGHGFPLGAKYGGFGPGAFGPGAFGYVKGPGVYGPGAYGVQGGYGPQAKGSYRAPEQLSCIGTSFTLGDKQAPPKLMTQIVANVYSQGGQGGGYSGGGGAYPGPVSPLHLGGHGLGVFPSLKGGYGPLPLGHGGHGGIATQGPLEASVNLYYGGYYGSSGKVKLLLTERAFKQEMGVCHKENFGYGLGPRGGQGGGGGYGQYDPYLGAQSGFVGANNLYAGGPPQRGGYGDGGYEEQPRGRGELATVMLDSHSKNQVTGIKLPGFRIKDLAGRGLVACTKVDVDYNGRTTCAGEILACCSFVYDNKIRKLSVEKIPVY